jgi:hypothetical protein
VVQTRRDNPLGSVRQRAAETLVNWARVHLEPGERKQIPLTLEEMQFLDLNTQ